MLQREVLRVGSSLVRESGMLLAVSGISHKAWHLEQQQGWQVDGATTASLVEATYTVENGVTTVHEMYVLAVDGSGLLYRLTIDWHDGSMSRDDALRILKAFQLRSPSP